MGHWHEHDQTSTNTVGRSSANPRLRPARRARAPAARPRPRAYGYGYGFGPGAASARFGPWAFRGRPTREEWVRRLEEYQKDLEQEAADVADLIRRLQADGPDSPTSRSGPPSRLP